MRKLITFLLLTYAFTAGAQINIRIDATSSTTLISPRLYGIFYEDINHAADGGIYAELIRNRSFEDNETEAEAWSPYISVNGRVRMRLVRDKLMNRVQRQALHVVTTGIGDTDAGVQNEGFWGINAVKGRTYRVSMWIKVKRTRGIYVMLKGKNGTKFYASARLRFDMMNDGWQKATATLTSTANDPEARFVISSTGNSEFSLDMVSLFPPTYKNRENGLRPDLVEMLCALHPRFMRFPGGCFVEGQDTPDNAFRWERTIGPVEERPGHWNKNWGYRTSDGVGFHEYLQLAEDLGAKPLYVTNIGIWHGGVTPLDSLRMWIDECMNALEYANGDVKTKYGAMRAANGHPEPFNIEYIEIGNENNQDDGLLLSDKYIERYRAFRNAILRKYPKMKIIGNVAAWGTDDPRWKTKDKVDLVDEHYYRSPSWFAGHFHKYDSYSRSLPDVYCGEYAVTQGFGKSGNLHAALGEAVFMMGMENNSDIVKMSSYAPIFGNENDDRWLPDMVRFNSQSVMGTPSYYVQKMMADNIGTRVVRVTENADTLFSESTQFTPEQSHVGLGTWNTQSIFTDLQVTAGTHTLFASGKKADDFTLRATTWDVSSSGLAQTGDGTPSTCLLNTPIGGRKYSVSVRAKRNAGAEGFLILFNYEDKDNYCWLNIGGSNNTCHCIEQVRNGGKKMLCRRDGKIETGKWYDVRIDVYGNTLTAYLDGERLFTTELRGDNLPGIFTSASVDDNTGELIVKIVNTSGNRENTVLHLDGFTADGADLIRLRSKDGYDENTLDRPTTVYPTRHHIALEGTAPDFVAEPYSLNILRIKKK